MKKSLFLLILGILLILGCKESKVSLSPGDFEIVEANWDPEVEFDCEKCDKPVCNWNMAWELKYRFSPKDEKDEALCLFYTNGRVKVESISQRNKMLEGIHKTYHPSLLLDCWEDHMVGVCCAYTTKELISEEYVCKEVLLEALCQRK